MLRVAGQAEALAEPWGQNRPDCLIAARPEGSRVPGLFHMEGPDMGCQGGVSGSICAGTWWGLQRHDKMSGFSG